MAEVVESTDVEVGVDILSRTYASIRVSAREGPQRVRIAQQHLGRLLFDQTFIGMTIGFSAEPVPLLYIGRLHGGTAGYTSPGSDADYTAGDIFVAAQPGLPFSARLHAFDADLAGLDPSLLGEVAQPGPGVFGDVRLLSNSPYSAVAARRWWRIHAFVRDSVSADPVGWAHPCSPVKAPGCSPRQRWRHFRTPR